MEYASKPRKFFAKDRLFTSGSAAIASFPPPPVNHQVHASGFGCGVLCIRPVAFPPPVSPLLMARGPLLRGCVGGVEKDYTESVKNVYNKS